MNFTDLLHAVVDEPVFDTGFLLVGGVDAMNVRKQLSRWVKAGNVYQLRRGLYALAPPYRKVVPHTYLVANRVQRGSYVSLQSALAYYGMIPEAVYNVTSVTTGRPATYYTPLGAYIYQHIQVSWFHGYKQIDLGNRQNAFIATPEKALLDLLYLTPGGATPEYLQELRLQALDQLDVGKLRQLAQRSGKPKLERAIDIITRLIEEEKEYRPQ
jgi:predicted transcriptional regulator of viral defense system